MFELTQKQQHEDKGKVQLRKFSEFSGSNGSLHPKQKKKEENPDESKLQLLNQSMKGNDMLGGGGATPQSKISLPGISKIRTGNVPSEAGLETFDEDREFLELTDLVDMDRTYIDSAMDKFDETLFDSFTYAQILGVHSLQYLAFKVFQMYNLFQGFHIQLEKLINFSQDVS